METYLKGAENFTLPIIAADGAVHRLYERSIIPSVIIGDMDSIVSPLPKIPLIHIEDQSRCYYEKAMSYLMEHQLLPTIVLVINGGELDHILKNISIFMSYPPGNLLYAPPVYGTLLYPSHYTLTVPARTKIQTLNRRITVGLTRTGLIFSWL